MAGSRRRAVPGERGRVGCWWGRRSRRGLCCRNPLRSWTFCSFAFPRFSFCANIAQQMISIPFYIPAPFVLLACLRCLLCVKNGNGIQGQGKHGSLCLTASNELTHEAIDRDKEVESSRDRTQRCIYIYMSKLKFVRIRLGYVFRTFSTLPLPLPGSSKSDDSQAVTR